MNLLCGAPKDLEYAGWVVWNHFVFFWQFFVPSYFSYLGGLLQHCFAVRLLKCFLDHKTLPGLWSAWGWGDNDSFLFFFYKHNSSNSAGQRCNKWLTDKQRPFVVVFFVYWFQYGSILFPVFVVFMNCVQMDGKCRRTRINVPMRQGMRIICFRSGVWIRQLMCVIAVWKDNMSLLSLNLDGRSHVLSCCKRSEEEWNVIHEEYVNNNV